MHGPAKFIFLLLNIQIITGVASKSLLQCTPQKYILIDLDYMEYVIK